MNKNMNEIDKVIKNAVDKVILSDNVFYIKAHHLWLIETQLAEIRRHRTRRKIADEFIDIISISLQAVERLGFDVPKTLWNRIGHNHKRRIKKIVGKYLELYRMKIERDILERENNE